MEDYRQMFSLQMSLNSNLLSKLENSRILLFLTNQNCIIKPLLSVFQVRSKQGNFGFGLSA